MMMALDMFVFEIGTLPYTALSQRLEWRFADVERLKAAPESQFLGRAADKISLTGALYPGYVGKFSAFDTLTAMADTGESYTLVSGIGDVMGQWQIRSLDVNTSIFLVDGLPRKADFTLELVRQPDD